MNPNLLTPQTIMVNAAFVTKEEAIKACGRLLLSAGHIEEPYIEKMLERDRMSTTYVGSGVAVPHGTKDSKQFIRSTGMALIQIPQGIDFGNGNIARVLIGLAAVGDEHLELLTEIALVCSEDAKLETLISAKNAEEILRVITSGENV